MRKEDLGALGMLGSFAGVEPYSTNALPLAMCTGVSQLPGKGAKPLELKRLRMRTGKPKLVQRVLA